MIGLAVAELGRGVGRLAERAVERRSVFSRVGQDGRPAESVGVEFAADARHAPVHHIGGGHDVRAFLGLGQGSLGQEFERQVVLHLAIFDHPAMAVAGVLAKTHIADDEEVRNGLLHRPDGALHDAFRVVGARAGFILFLGNSEENDRRNAEAVRRLTLLNQPVHRPAIVAGHGRYLGFDVSSRADEKRIDQRLRAERGFTHQAAQGFRAP